MVDSSALSDLPAVTVDDEGGARMAAHHLLALGHRDLLVIGVEPPAPSQELERDGVMGRRLQGYVAALAAQGLTLEPSAVLVGPASIEGGIACLRRAWSDGLRPTGVLVMSDAMAIGVMLAAREFGLRVPEGLSVVGCDGIDVSQHTNPPLTTVHQPIRRKGESAVRLLLTVVQRRDLRPEQLRLETRLIVRGSSGPAPRRRQEVEPTRH